MLLPRDEILHTSDEAVGRGVLAHLDHVRAPVGVFGCHVESHDVQRSHSTCKACDAAIHSSLVGSTATRTRLAGLDMVAACWALAYGSTSSPSQASAAQMRPRSTALCSPTPAVKAS